MSPLKKSVWSSGGWSSFVGRFGATHNSSRDAPAKVISLDHKLVSHLFTMFLLWLFPTSIPLSPQPLWCRLSASFLTPRVVLLHKDIGWYQTKLFSRLTRLDYYFQSRDSLSHHPCPSAVKTKCNWLLFSLYRYFRSAYILGMTPFI